MAQRRWPFSLGVRGPCTCLIRLIRFLSHLSPDRHHLLKGSITLSLVLVLLRFHRPIL
ncbi:hypothetical protein BofuT4_uP003610.1 [Botrytis cinerea T4]|uniref:Uncharacterized protein n=1 Tax=Botryotinia fuckeliana (strain T4) TaxID=999810 RepID=G2Y3G2_BOTF4|nr:hypothetical protein BofuT4_uP003610.1 [Botrytis cinerea T4]